jgi:hypothetical protein
MASVFELGAFAELIDRIQKLPPSAGRQWGKMNVSQMLEHVSRAVEMAMGRGKQQQRLLGRLLGWAFKAKFVGNEPVPRNSPTGPDFIVTGEPEFEATKARLLGLVRELHAMGESGCDGHVHLFFGRMSGAEWGATQYKHLDHHLRQFGG